MHDFESELIADSRLAFAAKEVGVLVFWISAGLMAATAVAHSVVGERQLIRPALGLQAGILRVPLARQVLRFAWHLTSVLMLLSAALVAWPSSPHALVGVAGAVWLAVGLVDAAYTRGKHLGWPLLSAAGALSLVGALLAGL
jgi:hypothetical protein